MCYCSYSSAALVGCPYEVLEPTDSVKHGQCISTLAVIFTAAQYHCPLNGTKLYCLATRDTRVHEQLAQGRYMKVAWMIFNHHVMEKYSQHILSLHWYLQCPMVKTLVMANKYAININI